MRSGDEDALTWEGDDESPAAGAPPAASPSSTTSGNASDTDREPSTRVDAPESDEAATESDSSESPEPVALPKGYDAVGKGSEGVGRIEADGSVTMPGDKPQLSSAALIAVGILSGVYLLLTVGWLLGGLRLKGVSNFLVADAAFVPFFWLAVLAPVLWFAASWLLTRHSATWVRILWLVIGVVLLLPWPFIMLGAVGTV